MPPRITTWDWNTRKVVTRDMTPDEAETFLDLYGTRPLEGETLLDPQLLANTCPEAQDGLEEHLTQQGGPLP